MKVQLSINPISNPNNNKKAKKKKNTELEKLLDFYGKPTTVEYDRETFSAPADVSIHETRLEWKGFKSLLFEEMKGFSLQKLALQFFKSEAKCVTFPNIKTLLSIAMVLPMSTATVSFSYMKQIKNRLRNRLQPSSLSKLMMIAIEGPQLDEVNFDAVLSLWKSIKPRRILL